MMEPGDDPNKVKADNLGRLLPALAFLVSLVLLFRSLPGSAMVCFVIGALGLPPIHRILGLTEVGRIYCWAGGIAISLVFAGFESGLSSPSSLKTEPVSASSSLGAGETSAGMANDPEYLLASGEVMASSDDDADRVHDCEAVDGDTLRCGEERIRLLGIDAPELPGHCREGRECAPGDPYAARSSLQAALAWTMRIERVGTDRYGRTIAMVYSGISSLSCEQLRKRDAIYKENWDDGHRVQQECSSYTAERY